MDTCIELQNAVESFSDGNKESFNQIYDLSYRYLHTCVIHVVKDEDIAMDVLQETYLEISKSIVQLKNKEGFLNWTATIANRKSYAYLRKRKDTLLYADNEEDESDNFFENIADSEEFIPETVLQNREKQRLIKEIIDGLTDIQRICVIGFYFNEQKQDEIAEELSIPVNTVKSHLNRAKAKIKEAVVDLDKKKGTRLYSMAPFMLLFFKEEVKACVLKPMAATLASEVGALATGRNLSESTPNVIARVKSLWTKSATAMKAKVVAGVAVGAITVGGVLIGLNGQPKGEKISLEFKNLLDQIIEICEDGNFEQLSDLDEEWEALFEQWEENDAESVCFYQTGASEYKFFDENQEVIHNCFYNGKDVSLQKNYTGYGVGINNNELALGYFKDGKAEGELTTLLIGDMQLVCINVTTAGADDVEDKAANETAIIVESEAVTDRNLILEFNGGSYTAEEKEYEEIYITYEDMEPTKMYAIRYTEMYPDLNASEGVLRMDGCLFEGDEITIDGKGTFNDVEYYRIKRPDNCFNPYHSIVPADALSLKTPAEQQTAAVQSVEIIAEEAPAKIFNYDGQFRLYYVTKMQIENGSIIGNVEITSYYNYQKFDCYEGSVSLVGYYDQPRRWDGYAFTDKVAWTMYDYDNSDRQDGLPIEAERVFYMNEQGMIDKNRHVIENDMIIDVKSGYPVYLIGERPQGSMFDNIYVSMVYFDEGNEMKQGYNMIVK